MDPVSSTFDDCPTALVGTGGEVTWPGVGGVAAAAVGDVAVWASAPGAKPYVPPAASAPGAAERPGKVVLGADATPRVEVEEPPRAATAITETAIAAAAAMV